MVGLAPDGSVGGGIGGITRLQKLLFLLEQEEQVVPSGDRFNFRPYKAGPFSPKLYDDLEFLENLGFIESEVTATATEPEAEEVDKLSFEDLIEGEDGGRGGNADEASMKAADAFEERRYKLTGRGREQVEKLLARSDLDPLMKKIRRVKSRFGSYALSDLLYYVYKKYEGMTVESEIKAKVLRGRRN